MFQDIPIISINIKVMKFWSLIVVKNWHLYACLVPAGFSTATQFLDMFLANESVDTIIRNAYFLVLWWNSVVRACLLLWNRNKFATFMNNLADMYRAIEKDGDEPIRELLRGTTKKARLISGFNLFLGTLVSTGFVMFPLFTKDRALPYGMTIPGIDKYASPYYVIFYTFQVVITPIGCCLYIPFTNIIVSFMMFGTVIAHNLQHRLKRLKERDDTDELVNMKIVWCLEYHLKIVKYTKDLDDLFTYIALLEFLTFGAILCALLFLLNISKSLGQASIVFSYIFMVMNQIFTLYWNATELSVQNNQVAVAAYDSAWVDFSVSSKKALLLIILRAQQPQSVTVGNVYPMTMQTFQSIINAAYSFFTLLRRFYD